VPSDTGGCGNAIGSLTGVPLVGMVGSVDIDRRPARRGPMWPTTQRHRLARRYQADVRLTAGTGQAGVTTHELLRLLGRTLRTDATIDRVEPGRLLKWRTHARRKQLHALAWWSRPARPAAGSARWPRVASSVLRLLASLAAWLLQGRATADCCWRRRLSTDPHRRRWDLSVWSDCGP